MRTADGTIARTTLRGSIQPPGLPSVKAALVPEFTASRLSVYQASRSNDLLFQKDAAYVLPPGPPPARHLERAPMMNALYYYPLKAPQTTQAPSLHTTFNHRGPAALQNLSRAFPTCLPRSITTETNPVCDPCRKGPATR